MKYGGRFDVALLADPDPQRMAQIRTLLHSPEEQKSRSDVRLELASVMPDEEQWCGSSRLLRRRLKDRLGLDDERKALGETIHSEIAGAARV